MFLPQFLETYRALSAAARISFELIQSFGNELIQILPQIDI